MMKPVMGIQLYTLRDFCETPEDFDNTLARLEAMGVDTVQISAIGDFSAEIQKQILDKHLMQVCITHKPFDRICDDLDALISEHKVINCDALGLGSMGQDYRDTAEHLHEFIDKCCAVGKRLSENGMTFNYHNHDFEFKKLADSDKTMMDILISETQPKYFHFIPDVAWIHYAGYDPVEYLHKLKGRVKVVHFKDYIIDENGERRFVSLGEGRVDLEACYRAGCELDIPYIMYEQDCDWVDGDAFKATEQSWKFMQSLSL